MMVLHLLKSKTQELWNMKCALSINDIKIEVKVITIHGKLCNLQLFTTCAWLFLQAFCIQFVTWIPSEVRKEPNWDNHIDHIMYNLDQTSIVCGKCA
jgi:hypothetical protein